MKIYLLYHLSKNQLYGISDNRRYIKRFLKERNPKLFKVITNEYDDDEFLQIKNKNPLLILKPIPLENKNGDMEIIGTSQEDYKLTCVCEQMSETCEYLKLYFEKNVPFNNEYAALINDITTISKPINNHPIIQIDTVKLFYHIFKETFINDNSIKFITEMDGDLDEINSKFGIFS